MLSRSEQLSPWRTGGDHWDAPITRGRRLCSLISGPSPSTKQLMWFRIIHSKDWCLCLALLNHTGACQKWKNELLDTSRCITNRTARQGKASKTKDSTVRACQTVGGSWPDEDATENELMVGPVAERRCWLFTARTQWYLCSVESASSLQPRWYTRWYLTKTSWF